MLRGGGRGGSGEFKVGEDRDGERKGEQEGERGAEYSAAVSRLADSGCSCSECGMRGRRKKTAVKRAKGDGAEKERTSACIGKKKMHTNVRRLVFWCFLCARASVQECECEFPLAVL